MTSGSMFQDEATPTFLRPTASFRIRGDIQRESVRRRAFSTSEAAYEEPATNQLPEEPPKATQLQLPKQADFRDQLLGKKATQESLAKVPLFRQCSPKFVEMLAEQVSRVVVQAGTMIMREGEYGDSMYILNRGEVEILVGGHSVATLSDGAIFGEMAAICKNPAVARRTASVRAKTLCDCRVTYREALLNAMGLFHVDAAVLEAEVSRRLEDLREKGMLPKKLEWWRLREEREGREEAAAFLSPLRPTSARRNQLSTQEQPSALRSFSSISACRFSALHPLDPASPPKRTCHSMCTSFNSRMSVDPRKLELPQRPCSVSTMHTQPQLSCTRTGANSQSAPPTLGPLERLGPLTGLLRAAVDSPNGGPHLPRAARPSRSTAPATPRQRQTSQGSADSTPLSLGQDHSFHGYQADEGQEPNEPWKTGRGLGHVNEAAAATLPGPRRTFRRSLSAPLPDLVGGLANAHPRLEVDVPADVDSVQLAKSPQQLESPAAALRRLPARPRLPSPVQVHSPRAAAATAEGTSEADQLQGGCQGCGDSFARRPSLDDDAAFDHPQQGGQQEQECTSCEEEAAAGSNQGGATARSKASGTGSDALPLWWAAGNKALKLLLSPADGCGKPRRRSRRMPHTDNELEGVGSMPCWLPPMPHSARGTQQTSLRTMSSTLSSRGGHPLLLGPGATVAAKAAAEAAAARVAVCRAPTSKPMSRADACRLMRPTVASRHRTTVRQWCQESKRPTRAAPITWRDPLFKRTSEH